MAAATPIRRVIVSLLLKVKPQRSRSIKGFREFLLTERKMRRKALLIAHPGIGEDPMLGVFNDVKRYERFLCSPIGGFLKDDEIAVLKQPDAKEVLSAVEWAKDADYSVVVFSGHGSRPRMVTMISLGDDELAAPKLKTGERQTIILDCCRSTPTVVVEELRRSLAKAKAPLNATRCRYYYDKRIWC